LGFFTGDFSVVSTVSSSTFRFFGAILTGFGVDDLDCDAEVRLEWDWRGGACGYGANGREG